MSSDEISKFIIKWDENDNCELIVIFLKIFKFKLILMLFFWIYLGEPYFFEVFFKDPATEAIGSKNEFFV